MGKYDIEALKKENSYYNFEHTVTQFDVDKANMYVELIESSRNNNRPTPGDIVQFTTKHGDYYENAHIETVNKDVYICENAYVPFIRPDKKGGITCNTSGGAWTHIPVGLKLIGKRKKAFCDLGHCGACGNGAIDFSAEVNVWKYFEPEPLYGDYSTKLWRKLYISHTEENERYQYLGDGIAWKNKYKLDEYINKYKGVVFPGHYINQIVVWCYREKTIHVELEELEKMNLPETTIYLNGERKAKMEVDDTNKIIIHYANW